MDATMGREPGNIARPRARQRAVVPAFARRHLRRVLPGPLLGAGLGRRAVSRTLVRHADLLPARRTSVRCNALRASAPAAQLARRCAAHHACNGSTCRLAWTSRAPLAPGRPYTPIRSTGPALSWPEYG